MRMRQRAVAALAAGAALSLLGSTMASAHECYKERWAEKAYGNVASGTAWVPVSEMARMYVVAPHQLERCGPVSDAAIAGWVEASGMDQEPLVHSKATIGAGAYYHKGKNPPPIGYLNFGSLMGALVPALAEAGCALPPME